MNDIQAGLLEMITDIDRALRKNDVLYTLDGGSLLGAVRHKGFIPWDDDMDIILFKKDEKAFENALKDLPEGKYEYQRPLSIDWANKFGKIRLNGSTAIEESHRDTRMHQGLFVDVFFLLDYPEGRFRRFIYKSVVLGEKAIQLASFRTYGRPRLDWMQKLLRFANRTSSVIKEAMAEKDTQFCKCDFLNGDWTFRKEWYMETQDTDFEGLRFPIPVRYDDILTEQYGDYMQLPPEDKRQGTHLVFYSRNIDYRDWLAERVDSDADR